MNRWASVQRQKPNPTAALTKSPGGMFHQEGPTRCGALTRAANTATRTKKIDRKTTPAALNRREVVGAGTVALGAHRKRARPSEVAPADSDLPLHRSDLRPTLLANNPSRNRSEAYTNLTAKCNSGKVHCRARVSAQTDGLPAAAGSQQGQSCRPTRTMPDFVLAARQRLTPSRSESTGISTTGA
jgi:hypothetical protein